MRFVCLFPSKCGFLLVALWLATTTAGRAADGLPPAPAQPFDFAEPKILTGTIYALGSTPGKILFRFRRTATRTGDTVRVRREFLAPNGSEAAEEDAVYESGRLRSFQMQEFQAGISGDIQIAPDPKNPARQKLWIGYGHGLQPPKGNPENLPADTVIDDTLYPFMLAHWDGLMRGDDAKFHFVSLEWKRTFGFRLVKTGETVRHGRAFVQIKMEPTSLLVAELVKPLVFTVEKDGRHRIFSYVGRTTPRIKKGKAWKYLDAETVFDW